MNIDVNDASKKSLGLWTLTALVVGNMVGSGIFLLPANLARLGKSSLLSWAVTATGALFFAFILSRMSQVVARNGGPYAYARAGLGNFVGFQTVYNHWVAMWVGNLGLVIALVGYLGMLWSILLNPLFVVISGVGIIWLATSINVVGVRLVGIVQIISVILKLLPIVLLIVFGFWYFHFDHIKEAVALAEHSRQAISSAAGLTLWAFVGVESATIPYSHVINPRRNIPLATLIGTIVAASIYILSSTVIMGMLPAETLLSGVSPFISAAQVMFGTWGRFLVIIGAIISCFGCINGWTFLQGQLPMAAANNNLFPQVFGLRNAKGIPVRGLVITALLETIILCLTLYKDLLGQLQLLVLMASLAALIPYLYMSLASLVLLRKTIKVSDGKHMMLDIVLFVVATITSIYAFWMITISGEKEIFYGSIFVFISALLYCWQYGEINGREKNSA